MKKVFLFWGLLSAFCIGTHASEQPRRSSDPSDSVTAQRRRFVFSPNFLEEMERRAKTYEDIGNDANDYLAAIDARKHLAAGSYDVEKELEELEVVWDSSSSTDDEEVMNKINQFRDCVCDNDKYRENAQQILADYKKVNWLERISLWEKLVLVVKD